MAGTARMDKVDPISGSFRGRLAAAWPSSDKGLIYGVGLNSSGQLVKGAGASGIVGVVCLASDGAAAGQMVDVMTHGEIADMHFLNDGTTATIAGTVYYADATTGVPTVTATSNKKIGVLLEKDTRDRLIVRVGLAGTGA